MINDVGISVVRIWIRSTTISVWSWTDNSYLIMGSGCAEANVETVGERRDCYMTKKKANR